LLEATGAFQGAGVEVARAHLGDLGHLVSDFPQAGQQGHVLEAVGLGPRTGHSAVRRSLQVLGALNAGCFIDEDAQALPRAVQGVGQRAGTGSMQRVAAVIESGLLGRLKFGLSARRSSSAKLLRGGPAAAWQGLD